MLNFLICRKSKTLIFGFEVESSLYKSSIFPFTSIDSKFYLLDFCIGYVLLLLIDLKQKEILIKVFNTNIFFKDGIKKIC